MGAFFIVALFRIDRSTLETAMTFNEIMSSSFITVEIDGSLKVIKDFLTSHLSITH